MIYIILSSANIYLSYLHGNQIDRCMVISSQALDLTQEFAQKCVWMVYNQKQLPLAQWLH
jgi:hypothetical protein